MSNIGGLCQTLGGYAKHWGVMPNIGGLCIGGLCQTLGGYAKHWGVMPNIGGL